MYHQIADSGLIRLWHYESVAGTSVRFSHHDETADEFDARYEKFLNRPDIDGWELRKAMNDLQGHDLVPEPKIVIAAMKACRRVNDYALAVRYLEAVKASRHRNSSLLFISTLFSNLTKLSVDLVVL